MIPTQRQSWDLFIASFATLFFEMLLVRWLPTEIYLLGYYKNCILFATFVGFGVGCATQRDCTRVLPVFALLLALLIIGVRITERYVALIPWQTGEFLWPSSPEESLLELPLLVFLAAGFTIAAGLTLPLGRLVGRHLGTLPPVRAYSVNLLASLLGIAAFLVLGFLELGPTVWYVVALLPLTYFMRGSPRALVAHLTGVSLVVALLYFTGEHNERWSPYSKITITEASPLFNTRLLSTNNSGHQVLYDLSPLRLAHRADPTNPGWRFVDHHVAVYDSAYAIIRPKSVLIIGGGTGNEAAAALRNGAEKVHVVEIDPVIISLGIQFHPEKPYADSRVTVINDDARHYMAVTDDRYDLVVFGFLDSKSQLSSMANIRMDNYVYTLESFERARELLTPHGVLQVTYYALADFVRLRIYLMLERTFGHRPQLFGLGDAAYHDFVYFSGPGLEKQHYELPGLRRWDYPKKFEGVDAEGFLTTDDWPYLNLQTRSIGKDYRVGLGVMALITLVFVYVFLWAPSGGVRSSRRTPWLLFLQGAGFMVLETNTIMRMTLILGSTWIVASFAIALVLAGALCANAIVARSSLPGVGASLCFVCAALLLNYFVGVHDYLGLPRATAILVAGTQVYLPILGSSLLFARIFAGSRESPFDFGINILGAVCGGILEYSSLALGVRTVYLVALALFLILTLVYMRPERSTNDAVG